jgi:hypothetical protein
LLIVIARECTWATIAATTFSGQLTVHVLLPTQSGMPTENATMSCSSIDGSLSTFLGHALAAVVLAR